MKNIIVKYGATAGLGIVFLSLVNWYILAPSISYYASEVVGYTSILVSLLTIPVAIRHYKNTLNNNLVSFKDGCGIGLGISFMASSFMFVHSYLFFILEGDNFLKWAKDGMPPEEWAIFEQQMAELPPMFLSPWFQGLVMFLTVFSIGLVITLISAALLQDSKENETTST